MASMYHFFCRLGLKYYSNIKHPMVCRICAAYLIAKNKWFFVQGNFGAIGIMSFK